MPEIPHIAHYSAGLPHVAGTSVALATLPYVTPGTGSTGGPHLQLGTPAYAGGLHPSNFNVSSAVIPLHTTTPSLLDEGPEQRCIHPCDSSEFFSPY